MLSITLYFDVVATSNLANPCVYGGHFFPCVYGGHVCMVDWTFGKSMCVWWTFLSMCVWWACVYGELDIWQIHVCMVDWTFGKFMCVWWTYTHEFPVCFRKQIGCLLSEDNSRLRRKFTVASFSPKTNSLSCTPMQTPRCLRSLNKRVCHARPCRPLDACALLTHESVMHAHGDHWMFALS